MDILHTLHFNEKKNLISRFNIWKNWEYYFTYYSASIHGANWNMCRNICCYVMANHMPIVGTARAASFQVITSDIGIDRERTRITLLRTLKGARIPPFNGVDVW